MKTFVQKRLVKVGDNELETKFHDVIKLNKPAIFALLYEVLVKGKIAKEKIQQVGRGVMHRLFIAYETRRKVNLSNIMEHELMPVLLVLVETNGVLCIGEKHILLADALIAEVNCPSSIQIDGISSIFVDGHACTGAIVNPSKARSLEILQTSTHRVFFSDMRKNHNHIEVTFDRYRYKL